MYKAFRSVRCPHSRLILHWRGLGTNSLIGPEALDEVLQPCAVVWDIRYQFLVMPPVVYPAEAQLFCHQRKLRRVITHQQADHRKLQGGMIGRHGCRIQDPFPLLGAHSWQVGIQQRVQRRLIHEHPTRQLLHLLPPHRR